MQALKYKEMTVEELLVRNKSKKTVEEKKKDLQKQLDAVTQQQLMVEATKKGEDKGSFVDEFLKRADLPDSFHQMPRQGVMGEPVFQRFMDEKAMGPAG